MRVHISGLIIDNDLLIYVSESKIINIIIPISDNITVAVCNLFN